MNTLARLQQWYEWQNKGKWEDGEIKIETFSNPCWFVSIRLKNTTLDGAEFSDIDEGVAGTPSWSHCYVERNVWKGAGDNLERLLELFLFWATPPP